MEFRRVLFRLAGDGHYLAVVLRGDFVLIRNLVYLALFGHQNDFVTVSDALLYAGGVAPHPLAPGGTPLIHDIAREAPARRRGGTREPVGTSASTCGWGVQDCQRFA